MPTTIKRLSAVLINVLWFHNSSSICAMYALLCLLLIPVVVQVFVEVVAKLLK